MHIKSIVLDGFKSYGNRVEITGFDQEFNAITGLNGTGKSNILDSICFVLGITNLSNVRAGSLQELIYKHGQAGITKATVSITFDNKNKEQCPIGYENHDEITVTRQVVMGGKNKYLINGLNVQNKRVSDLFCSVQLNVNNPHFLIMQGRITKVLNMKPLEILSMVEEAAGTKMYETKKQAAQKTIEKKDAKLRELNDIIREDIAPKLQKLQDERSQYQEYQKVVRECENLTRLHVAWNYVKLEEKAEEAERKEQGVHDDIQGKKEQIKMNVREAKEIDKQIKDMNRALDEESGNVLKGLEIELQDLEKIEASANSAFKANREAVSTQEKRGRLLERALADDETALQTKKSALLEVSSTFENLRTASETSEAVLAEAQQRFLAVSTGLEGDSESLQDQLMAAKQEASEASTRISQSLMEMKHAETRLKELEREFKSSSAQYQRDQDLIRQHQNQVDQLREELSQMNFNEERSEYLKHSVRTLNSAVRAKRDAYDAVSARLQRCNFRYTTPQPNFDPARVAGPVCNLIEVINPVYCAALEAVAGARLYNVVVDTEVTGKLLLERGNLQARTTFVPVNKITANIMDNRTLRLAQSIGGGEENVQLALDVVQYESRLRPALGWVFGNTLICRDMDTAKRVAFHPKVRRRCVTLDGDVFDPAGTISGGAPVKGVSVLVQLQELKKLEYDLKSIETQLSQETAEFNSMQKSADKYSSMQQKYEVMSHELEVVKNRIASTSHAQLHTEIETLRSQLLELTAAVEADKIKQKDTAARAKELEVKVKDIKGHREREFKKANEALKKAKKDAEYHSKNWKEREQELETLRLEVVELEQAVTVAQLQLNDTSLATDALNEALQEAKQEHAHALEAVKAMQDRIKKQKVEISSRNSNIAKLIENKENLGKTNSDLELQIKELEYKIKELQTEVTESQNRIRALETENPWISGERAYFGNEGGLYDFTSRGAHDVGQRLHQLRDRRDKLSRGLNSRAHTLLGKEEEQYQEVMRKKGIVEADRAKLIEVMAELDEKKKNTLVTACEQVNKDFGSIFSTLLPGAQAKLQPLERLTVLDGLEIKVGFNNTWKESLGELSGGQRSLVALSLVLAMLLFKPAPLYILDEVDAALDLSHTQNIGQMLKRHFTHSQFIIVSLKDGMFNNANVLFRTRFVDGMSAVQRTVNENR